ncbi:hypothetical protein OIU79_001178 [Salix purpurea]|uniref:Uncharacterized protein n=1 Tax=Salix purpurea TaxID=77065 RepID=A0A9Q0V4Y4_SALPP|nr:hypothetical protein OIU79_001178 [Salix purpurea]
MTSSDEVCAVMASNLPDHGRQHSLRQLSDAWEDNYECNYRVARRAFLSSYHFSEKNSIRDKLRRSVKEMNEVVVGVVSGIRQEICKRRVGIKVCQVLSANTQLLGFCTKHSAFCIFHIFLPTLLLSGSFLKHLFHCLINCALS